VIATGYDAGTLLDTIEVLDLSSESKTCNNLPNFPKPISSAVGGVHNLLKPVICGGFNAIGSASMDCFTLKDNLWTEVEIINISVDDDSSEKKIRSIFLSSYWS